MDIVVYSHYYRTRTRDRQFEIDQCLRRNLNDPGINRMVLFTESDAPPVPEGTVQVEVVRSDERITYAEWLRWVQRQGSGIGLLLNAGIYLDEGLEHLKASFNTPKTFHAHTRISNRLKKLFVWGDSIMKPMSCKSFIDCTPRGVCDVFTKSTLGETMS